MNIGYVNMERNNELAFEWDWGHDGSRRVKVLTTNGGYEIYNAYHVKMSLDHVPNDFVSDFSVDKFIYYPESDDEDAYVKSDRYYDYYLKEKQRLNEINNPKPETPEEEETYSKKEYDDILEQMRKQQEEMEEMKRQFEEFKKLMNGGSSK